jgi:hypothetical protein
MSDLDGLICLPAVYVCLLYSAGEIEYWENLECESDREALALMTTMISEGNWDVAELWREDELVHRLVKSVQQ